MNRFTARFFPAVAAAGICLYPAMALAQEPGFPGFDLTLGFCLILSFPLTLALTIAFLFTGRSALMVFAIGCAVGAFFSTLVLGLISYTLIEAMLVLLALCMLLILLKRNDLRSKRMQRSDANFSANPADHKNVHVYQKPQFRKPG